MPIRRSITLPDGVVAKEYARFKRDGPLPKAPDRKPPASEREPFLDALKSIPVGQNMSRQAWIEKWSSPFISIKYPLWGIDLAIYPMARHEHNDTKTCTGVLVLGLQRTRKGVQPKQSLMGSFDKSWFRTILEWIEETYYGG